MLLLGFFFTELYPLFSVHYLINASITKPNKHSSLYALAPFIRKHVPHIPPLVRPRVARLPSYTCVLRFPWYTTLVRLLYTPPPTLFIRPSPASRLSQTRPPCTRSFFTSVFMHKSNLVPLTSTDRRPPLPLFMPPPYKHFPYTLPLLLLSSSHAQAQPHPFHFTQPSTDAPPLYDCPLCTSPLNASPCTPRCPSTPSSPPETGGACVAATRGVWTCEVPAPMAFSAGLGVAVRGFCRDVGLGGWGVGLKGFCGGLSLAVWKSACAASMWVRSLMGGARLCKTCTGARSGLWVTCARHEHG